MARILFLTPQLPFPPQALTGLSQGTTIRNFNLMAGLARRHTVDLLTFLPEPSTLPSGLDLLHPYCRQVIAEKAPGRSLRGARDTLLSPLPDMALRLASPAMHAQLARLTRESDYDVIEVEGIEMARYALDWLAAVRAHRPGLRATPRLIFDDHNAEYVLQKRAFLTDMRQPRTMAGGSVLADPVAEADGV